MNLFLPIEFPSIVGQIFRYIVVGLIGTVSHFGVLIILVEYVRIAPVLASTAGFIMAVVVSYILNLRWTFVVAGSHVLYFPKYLLVCLTGLAINFGIMYLTVNVLRWWYILGQLCVVMIVPTTNFILNRFWTFANRGLLSTQRTKS